MAQVNQPPAANDEDQTFVLPVDATGFTGTYPNYSGTLTLGTASNQFTNYLFNVSGIQAGFYIADSKGALYQITNATFNSPNMDVDVTKVSSNPSGFISDFAPSGRVIVSEAEPHCGLINVTQIDVTGIDPITLAAIHNYNYYNTGNFFILFLSLL